MLSIHDRLGTPEMQSHSQHMGKKKAKLFGESYVSHLALAPESTEPLEAAAAAGREVAHAAAGAVPALRRARSLQNVRARGALRYNRIAHQITYELDIRLKLT